MSGVLQKALKELSIALKLLILELLRDLLEPFGVLQTHFKVVLELFGALLEHPITLRALLELFRALLAKPRCFFPAVPHPISGIFQNIGRSKKHKVDFPSETGFTWVSTVH